MAEFIDKQAFLEEQRHLYCENCERRKGMKRGKMQFVYEIGDAPCRSCGYGDVLDDLEDFPAADVRPVVKARWVYTDMSRLVCSNCGNPVAFALKDDGWHHGDYCPNCGTRMGES